MQPLACTKCGHVGPDDDFAHHKSNSRRRYRSSWCRPCHRASTRSWYDSNKRRPVDPQRERRAAGVLSSRKRNNALGTRYGITEIEYEAMVVRQSGLCLICEKRPEKLHVDHCHETGEVRGLLCGNCNRHLGFLENRQWFAAASSYLGGDQ